MVSVFVSVDDIVIVLPDWDTEDAPDAAIVTSPETNVPPVPLFTLVTVFVLVSVDDIVIVFPDWDTEDAPDAAIVTSPLTNVPPVPLFTLVTVFVLVSVEDIVNLLSLVLVTVVAPLPTNSISSVVFPLWPEPDNLSFVVLLGTDIEYAFWVLVSVLVSVALIVIVFPDWDTDADPEAAIVISPLTNVPPVPLFNLVIVLVSVFVSVALIVIVLPDWDTEAEPDAAITTSPVTNVPPVPLFNLVTVLVSVFVSDHGTLTTNLLLLSFWTLYVLLDVVVEVWADSLFSPSISACVITIFELCFNLEDAWVVNAIPSPASLADLISKQEFVIPPTFTVCLI